ncbi:hypothetical protein F4859DRAFT_464922, partial [Xylaria cf. heliscus]
MLYDFLSRAVSRNRWDLLSVSPVCITMFPISTVRPLIPVWIFSDVCLRISSFFVTVVAGILFSSIF